MSTSAISGIIPTVASQTLTLPNGYINSIGYQNSGQQLLVSGIATSGIVFKPGELASGGGLTATIGGVQVAVQVDVKTTYADGSAKMAVLSLARPDIAAGATVEALLAVAPAGTLSPPALNLDTALAGHSFAVDITTAGVTSHVDVLAALHDALAHGTASFWQTGALASQARVEVALGGSQRLVFDVTAFANGAWQGDAHYSVTLDGAVLVADGVATASHAAGAHGLVDLHPALAAGPHSLVVSFTNDAWGGTAATDRNLYVDAISLNGLDLGKQAALLSAGHASFTFTSGAAVAAPVVVANDTLHIGLSADSWQGDPRFLIFIDGKQVGLEHSAAASHAAGQVEFLDVLVAHTAGVHQLDVRFTNDAWGGTALFAWQGRSTDRRHRRTTSR